ncbi:MAG: hypothetical protein R3Y08_01590 [Rikenellaceae bacterium]
MNNKCNKYTTSDLMFYVRSKMTPDEESKLQFHIMSCEHCRAKVAQLRAAIESFSAEESSLAEEVENQDDEENRFFLGRRFFLMAASIAIFIIGGGMLTINYFQPNEDIISPNLNYKPSPIYNSVDDICIETDTLQNDTTATQIEIIVE